MKNKLHLASFVSTLLLSSSFVFGQTTLLDPTVDGGFENATSTFAANGWIQVGAAPPTWYVGTAAGAQGGTKAAFMGTNATTYGSSATAGVNHFYRDLVIPAGATQVYLNYYLKYPTIDNTWDYFYVFTTTTANTPVAGTIPGAGYTQKFVNTGTVYAGFTAMPQIDLSALAGTTVRLVFTFKNDGATPNANPAVDNISLVYTTPVPSAVVFYNTPANSALQTTFNNLRCNYSAPVFSLSSTYGSTFNRFQMELNSNETFTGTAYTQTFSGTYNSATKYDLTCNSLSPSLPTSDAVYFCRARASGDGGTTWGNWSSGQWYYTFSTAFPFGWHITSKPQFNLGSLIATNYGNFLVPNDNGTPASDYIDDWLELQQGSSDNSLTTAGDQALDEGGSYYSGASNNCITVGYYNITGNQDYHGFRFQSAHIPQGATILSATFTPYAHDGSGCGGSANTTNQLIMKIRGVNQDNCNAWAGTTNTATGDPQYRVRTAAGVNWNVPSGASQQWSTGLLITTAPDITSVIQEIVNRGSYAAGNALGLIVDHNSGVGNYWRYFATMSANVTYSARLQTTYTGFTNDIQYPNVALASFSGAPSWSQLTFDVDKSSCGACDATFYVYDASGPTLIASGNTSPISLGNSTAANVYVVVRLKRNNSPIFKSMTLTPNNGVLPIELTDLSAVCKDKTVQLNWATASEKQNDYFVVERSRDGNEMNFQAVAKLNGAGNSSTAKYYSATDNDIDGTNYYRLKQVDHNGNATYSKVISVSCRVKGLDITEIVPVPSDNYIDVYYTIEKDEELTFTIFDMFGREVTREKDLAHEGGNLHRIDLNNISSGVYYLTVKSTTDIVTAKIIKK